MLRGWLTQLGVALAAILTAVGGVLLYGHKKRNEGKKESQDDLIQTDAHIAKELRKSLRANRNKSVRNNPDAGWRD